MKKYHIVHEVMMGKDLTQNLLDSWGNDGYQLVSVKEDYTGKDDYTGEYLYSLFFQKELDDSDSETN